MAIVEGTYIQPPSPRRRGGLPLELSGWKGKIVARKRKGRKGPNKSPLQQAWVDNFSCIARWSKFADPRARETAEDMAPDTGWYWRDIIETAMVGKLIRRIGEHPITTPTVNIRKTSATSLSGTNETVLTPDEFLWDNNYFWNPISNQSRITFRSPGLYLVGADAQFGVSSTTRRKLIIKDQDGTRIVEQSQGPGLSTTVQIAIVGLMYFHANDYIECYAQASASGQTTVLNHFWAIAMTPEQLLPSP